MLVALTACDEPVPTSAEDTATEDTATEDTATEDTAPAPDVPTSDEGTGPLSDASDVSEVDASASDTADAPEPDAVPSDAEDVTDEDAPEADAPDSIDAPPGDVRADSAGDAPDSDTLEEDIPAVDTSPDAPDADVVPDLPVTEAPTYLVHSANDHDELWIIDVETGETTTVCSFDSDVVYPSTTFSLDGVFYGAGRGVLDRIDPCTCEVTPIGEIGYDGLGGITANGIKEWELYGLTFESDLLLVMDVEDGAGRPVGGLGRDFGYCGTTWASAIDGLYAIDANSDSLYQLNTETGVATDAVPLATTFGTVGIEWHPVNEQLYACTGTGLYRVDPEDGSTEFIPTDLSGCNNLAAPWTRIDCLEALLE